MRAGELREVLTIQANSPTRGTTGALVDNWTNAATLRGAPWSAKGLQTEALQGVAAENIETWTCRYYAGITTGMRALHGSRVLDIVAVEDVRQLHRELRLTLREGQE